MEKTLIKLFDIEDKANNIIRRANEEKVKLHDEFEAEVQNMEEEIASHNLKKLQDYKAQINRDIEKEKKVLAVKSETALKELEELYQENKDKLVKRIFNNIVSN